MDFKSIQAIIVTIICLLVIIVSSSYYIGKDKSPKTIEDEDKNKSELIFFLISLVCTVIFIVSLICLIIVDSCLKRLNFIRNPKIINIISIIFCCITIINTSFSWDLSSRNENGYGEREIFMFLTIIFIMLLLRLLDNL